MAEQWHGVYTKRGKLYAVCKTASIANRKAQRMAKQRADAGYVVPVYVSPAARDSARVPSLPDPLAPHVAQGPPAVAPEKPEIGQIAKAQQ